MTLFTKEMRYCPIPIAFILLFIVISAFTSDNEYYGALVGLSAITMGVIIMYQAVMISQNTKQKGAIPLSYICLAIAYMAYAVAELTWFILDYQGVETYPSIADHIYSIYFMFSLAHVYITYRFFVKRPTKKEKILVPIVFSILILVYGMNIFVEESEPTLFVYGGVFVGFASILLIFTGLVVYKLRNTKLFGAWAIIGGAIVLGAVGDLWYYPLDMFGLYDYGHPVDIIWMASDALLIFALSIHRKLI